jgi:leucyl aminopeptidase (aminopeptidase T)
MGPNNTKGKLQALADSHHAPGRGTQSNGSSNMLEQLLADPGASVLGMLEFADPLVDRGIELRKSFLLLEDGFVAKFGCTRGSEILADTRVEVSSP